MNQRGPSDYEKAAIKAIQNWKTPRLTWFGKALEVVGWPIEKAGDLVMDAPYIGSIIKQSVAGLVSSLNDVAHWSVRPEAIYKDFRNCGHDVRCGKDLFELDLEHVDRVIGWLGAKYKSLALAEGAITGYVGLAGIPPDIVALITLNQRAIGEYATYCGFDVSSQHERLFAMNILALASSPSDAGKTAAMTQLVRIARDVARKRTWKELEQHAFVRVIQIIAKALGIRLTKAKLAQAIPVTGSVVGGGYNAYYTGKVCDAGFYLYRERILAEKYGPDIIDTTGYEE
jgi:hypothetical protein